MELYNINFNGLDSNKRLSIDNIYCYIFLFFPIFTLLSDTFDWINKIMFFMLLLFQLMILALKRISLKSFFLMIMSLFMTLIALLNCDFKLYNFNELFYFPFYIIYFLFIIDNKDYFSCLLSSNKNTIKLVIIIWTLIIGVSMFFPSSYVISKGITSFVSIAGDTFRLTPTALFIMTLIFYLMVSGESKKWFYLVAFPMFCMAMGSTRTYFGVGVLLFLLMFYYYLNNRKKFLILLVPIVGIIIFIMMKSSIGDKIVSSYDYQNSYFDFWGTITSSRSVFWLSDIENYLSGSFFNKTFGYGFSFVYDINYLAVGTHIWAHNDFIQILCCYGIVGLAIYIYVIIEIFKILIHNRTNKLVLIICILIWLINAFFNMFYTYFCSILSFPVLLLCINCIYQNGGKNETK